MAMRYYGEPYRPLPRHVLRIGDAERDAAATDLGDHFVAGRLTLDELHERLGAVFAARTHGQLWNVMADLPGATTLARRTARPDGETVLVRPRPADVRNDTSSDRAGRFAALSLLLLAMLIWLFTAYLFARHGTYAHPGPWAPPH